MTFSTVFNKIKEILRRMLGMNTTIEQTLHIQPAVSNKMAEAIDEWSAMYEDKAPWLHEPTYSDPSMVVSLGLPSFIASEKARMAVLELQVEITPVKETKEVDNPNYFPPTSDEFGNVRVSGQPKTILEEIVVGDIKRANYLDDQFKRKLLAHIRTQLEFGIAKGSLIIKPYVIKKKVSPVDGVESTDTEEKYDMAFDFVQADCFYPFSFDSSGNLTEVAFLQTKTVRDTIFSRLEYHKLDSDGITIVNKAYQSLNNPTNQPMNGEANLGKEVALSTVDEWKNLPQVAHIKNVDRLLFGYFKMPEANTIDPHSPLGISGFARAKTLIREADKQYSRMLWEFEGGELAIDIDRDALANVTDFNGNTHSVNNHLQNRLFRSVDLGESDTYKPYSPMLRDASLVNGLNTILMRIEDVCAISRGTISNVASEARTATELKILKQRSYSSNAEIQKCLEIALRDVVYAMNVYCTLYNIVGDSPRDAQGNVDASKIGKYDIAFAWDDSILVDVDTELQKRLTLLNNGITSKQEVRMWYFGESQAQAQDALNKIVDESQRAIEQNMAVSSQMGKAIQDNNKKNGTVSPNHGNDTNEQQSTNENQSEN